MTNWTNGMEQMKLEVLFCRKCNRKVENWEKIKWKKKLQIFLWNTWCGFWARPHFDSGPYCCRDFLLFIQKNVSQLVTHSDIECIFMSIDCKNACNFRIFELRILIKMEIIKPKPLTVAAIRNQIIVKSVSKRPQNSEQFSTAPWLNMALLNLLI